MKTHLVSVQDIFNKNELMLSIKGNLFCNALKNQRELGFPAASFFFTHPLHQVVFYSKAGLRHNRIQT